MSTKAIRKALERVKGYSVHAADVRRAEDALAEVEAIRKAAQVLSDNLGVRSATARAEAQELMESVAKEAK